MLTNRLLAVHQTVVRDGSVTGAAAILGYTVSAVSEQVRRLEAEAGSALFEKVGRGVRPTAAGLLLADHADRILAAVDDAETALSDLRAGPHRRLRLVSFHSAGEALLPPAIARFRETHPDVAVSPIVDETPGALRRLRASDVEIVVVVEPFGVGGDPEDDLVRVHLSDDEYRLLLPREHPLAARRTIDLPALAASDWIVTAGPSDYVREGRPSPPAAGPASVRGSSPKPTSSPSPRDMSQPVSVSPSSRSWLSERFASTSRSVA